MFCHYMSNDLSLDFDQTVFTLFQKKNSLSILNDTTDTRSDDLSQSCPIVQVSMVQPHQVQFHQLNLVLIFTLPN